MKSMKKTVQSSVLLLASWALGVAVGWVALPSFGSTNQSADAGVAIMVHREVIVELSRAEVGTIIASVIEGGPPTGWLICDGSSIRRSDNPLLCAAITRRTGQGSEGEGSVRLPDYRGMRIASGWLLPGGRLPAVSQGETEVVWLIRAQ